MKIDMNKINYIINLLLNPALNFYTGICIGKLINQYNELFKKKYFIMYDANLCNIRHDLLEPCETRLISGYEISNQIDDEYIEILTLFINTLKRKTKISNLKTLENNLKTLSIYNNINFSDDAEGDYLSLINDIYLKSLNKNVLIHELLHMSSSKCNKKRTDANSNMLYFGRSINEGYTEILRDRYFYDENAQLSYIADSSFTSIIESIVGHIKMEQYYFNDDMNGLVNELSTYSDNITATNLINYMDEIDLYEKYTNDDINIEIVIQYMSKLSEINDILAKMLTNFYIKNNSFNINAPAIAKYIYSITSKKIQYRNAIYGSLFELQNADKLLTIINMSIECYNKENKNRKLV